MPWYTRRFRVGQILVVDLQVRLVLLKVDKKALGDFRPSSAKYFLFFVSRPSPWDDICVVFDDLCNQRGRSSAKEIRNLFHSLIVGLFSLLRAMTVILAMPVYFLEAGEIIRREFPEY